MMLHFIIGSGTATSESSAGFLQWLMRLSDVEEPWQLWIIAFGLIAQCVFFGRWVVQWIATERRGASHVPVSFWWLSLIGASLLLVYFVVRYEPVGVIGQSTGWIIYSRNLHLIRKSNRLAKQDNCEKCGQHKGPTPGNICPTCGHEWIA